MTTTHIRSIAADFAREFGIRGRVTDQPYYVRPARAYVVSVHDDDGNIREDIYVDLDARRAWLASTPDWRARINADDSLSVY